MRWALLLGAGLCLGAGCGATTVRLAVGPTLDAAGNVGFLATAGFGLGRPLGGRHYVQGLLHVGGGRTGQEGAGEAVVGLDAAYFHRARGVDVRTGIAFSFHELHLRENQNTELYGLGAHLAVLPVLREDWWFDWMRVHYVLGPELRAEYLWAAPDGTPRAQFSLPLVFEVNYLVNAGE